MNWNFSFPYNPPFWGALFSFLSFLKQYSHLSLQISRFDELFLPLATQSKSNTREGILINDFPSILPMVCCLSLCISLSPSLSFISHSRIEKEKITHKKMFIVNFNSLLWGDHKLNPNIFHCARVQWEGNLFI